jgi:Ca-activated chloride channel family protein
MDLESLRIGQPVYLWLLIVPAALGPLWLWRAGRRRGDWARFRQRRLVPVVERTGILGAWPFWLGLIGALALSLLAIARPLAAVAGVRTAGVDLVILQDGSASMHVTDVRPDRWQRSTRFLRVLAQSLRWQDDRIALALFARIAAPQVRLTRDPNTFFFFLDHLDRSSPFPLSDDTTWDTNIEAGIYWGLRLVEKDEELLGPSPNGRAFVLVSDGQAWSGEVDRSIRLARSRSIPIFVVGVGTQSGGVIPEPAEVSAGPSSARPATAPVRSVLDRSSLLTIAAAGGGQYFDLGRQTDRQIASTIIDSVRRRAGARGLESITEELYWPCLMAVAGLVCLSVLFVRDRTELWLLFFGSCATLLALWTLTR